MKSNMTKKSNETKRIYTKSVALELRRRGFRIIRTEPNENHPEFDVYVFESNQGLKDALTEITNSRSDYMKIYN